MLKYSSYSCAQTAATEQIDSSRIHNLQQQPKILGQEKSKKKNTKTTTQTTTKDIGARKIKKLTILIRLTGSCSLKMGRLSFSLFMAFSRNNMRVFLSRKINIFTAMKEPKES